MLARFDWSRILGFMILFGHYDCGGSGAGPDKKGRQKPTISVAGYLATAGQWFEHDRLWRARLKRDGFSYFHMTDFMANKKGTVFEKCLKWSENRKINFLKDLSDIIIPNVTYAIGMAVHRADYNKVLAEEPDALHSGLGSPYAFCAFRCFESGADWSIKHRSPEPINYIFERGDQHAEQVNGTHSFLCEFEPMRRRFWLGSLTFEPKCNTSLQAADLLTWALNRELYHQEYPEPGYAYLRPTLTNLLGSVDNMYKGYYEDDLRGYLDDLFKRPEGKFFIINVPTAIRQAVVDDVRARLEKRKQDEKTKRVSKIRRGNGRSVSRAKKRITTKARQRKASKGKKKAAS
jgi:hypothetical protein